VLIVMRSNCIIQHLVSSHSVGGRPVRRLHTGRRLGTEEKRGTTFRCSTDEIFETLGITKLDKEKNRCVREKNGSTEHSKRNKTVPEKVATTCTEDGHKQTTKTSTTI